MNVLSQVKIEIVYFQHFSLYTMETPPSQNVKFYDGIIVS